MSVVRSLKKIYPMKKFISLICIASLLTILFSFKSVHFISDAKYRAQVEKDFLARKELAKGRATQLFSVFDQNISADEKEALQFLYAYMPLSDLADYDGNFFLKQVQYAFKAKEEMPWGKTIPEDIFRHFVLVYRVNNENLDTARIVFFNELKDRVKNLSMYDAALEVNHWCHEKVTYRGADGRTSAPLATVRTALGRCGEQSTFTVTALRAVGIPARQCYTPRWAHSDDNHAWVEVWIDGKWYYLGACEPDPELNMGWFSTPATRTMMVHTNVFGKNDLPDEKNLVTPLYTISNMLNHYTETKKIKVTVLDENKKPVQDAVVTFRLYNYAEYYPIAKQNSNEKGEAQITTGMGDLLIWATKDGKYNYQKIDVRKQNEITLIMSRKEGETYTETFDIFPPVEKKVVRDIPQAVKDKHAKRLHYEDSLRNKYVATFMTEEETRSIHNENLTPEQIADAILRSEGNYAEIIKFLNNHSKKEDYLFLNDFLKSLSDKDLRDTPADILEAHVTHYTSFSGNIKHVEFIPKSEDPYFKGIMPARIANELIRPWRPFLKEEMSKILGAQTYVDAVMQWIKKNIVVNKTDNYYNCPISPRGVFELRIADPLSRDIFFVAVCRSMNIPAYLDLATEKLYVYENGTWKDVQFEASEKPVSMQKGKLELNFKPTEKQKSLKLTYWIHFTIARFENGEFVTYDFENDPRMADFPATLALDPGYYMLSTGNRYSDGVVLSRLEFFTVELGKTVTKDIIIRDLVPRDQNFGSIDLKQPLFGTLQGKTLESVMGEKKMVLCFIDPTREPTRHLFKDIAELRKEFESWGGTILFVIPSSKNTGNFHFEKWGLPKQSQFIVDEQSAFLKKLLKDTKMEFKDEYPLLLIINEKGQLTSKSEGYRIGAGEMILKGL
ncbi:MAG: Transglutaminase Domain-Containing Protein [Bacteroidetes bacterium]|nr:Transglutaminase Domain-Containing Protein [Bacteroidota bacterium]